MKTNHIKGLLFVLVLFLFSGCGKRNDIKWVFYDETNCADRWEHNINNEVLKENITNYFAGQNIKIYDLEIFSDRTPEGCSDCICKSGRRIKAKIKGKDLKSIKTEGFYE